MRAVPGAAMAGTVLVGGSTLYASDGCNLLLLDEKWLNDTTLRRRKTTDASEGSLARSRIGKPVQPLGWTLHSGWVMLYITQELAIPGGIAAHLLSRPRDDTLTWLFPNKGPWGVQDPLGVCRSADPEPPLAYVMPFLPHHYPPWDALGKLRTH